MPIRITVVALFVLSSAVVGVGVDVGGAATAGAYTERPSVVALGTAIDYGSTAALRLNAPINDIVATTAGDGYWLLAGDGGVFTFGGARFFGSTGDMVLNRPATTMAATATGEGYWFAAADGGVFSFGDAGFYGSMGHTPLNAPAIGIYPTATGSGYWLVAADGGVFSFGDAGFLGSLGDRVLPAPIVSFSPRPAGDGYWLADRDGRVYGFGAAAGLTVGAQCPDDVTDILAGAADGYWLLCANGWITAAGTAAPFPFWSPAAAPVAAALGAGQRAVGLARTSDGQGLWVATSGNAKAVLDAAARGTHAFLSIVDGQPVRWSGCRTITWRFDPVGAPVGSHPFVAEAFEHLGDLTGFTFVDGGPISVGDPLVAPVMVVGWEAIAGDAIGMARTLSDRTSWGARWGFARVALDLEETRSLTWDWTGWGPVLLHELGHAIGLGHVDDASELMYPETNGRVRFGRGDQEGLRRLSAANGC